MKVKRKPVLEGQDQIYILLGKRIAEARALLNWSQRELAEIVGLSRSSVNSVERGQQHLLVGDAILIAKVLGLRLDALDFERWKGQRQMQQWARARLNTYHLTLGAEVETKNNP